jgi:hypothetical protein
MQGQTVLIGGVPQGNAVARRCAGGEGMEFEKSLRLGADGPAVTLRERFRPAAHSIGWEIEIDGPLKPTTAPIETVLSCADPPEMKMWVAWGDGGAVGAPGWNDPLVAKPLRDTTYYYGGRGIADAKAMGLPLATLLSTTDDTGLSLVLSPEDITLDLTLSVTRQGRLAFRRSNHRLQQGRTVRFRMDLVPHAADWRGALDWMVHRYPTLFDPPNAAADFMAGCGAYSAFNGPLDTAKFRRMAFRINWNATFDWPYIGMFLPPVSGDTTWASWRKRPTRIVDIETYAASMRAEGFYALTYFNMAEFGTRVVFPLPPPQTANDADLWKNSNDYLSTKLAPAILRHRGRRITPAEEEARWEAGGVYYTWDGSIALDCGEPVYRDFLLDQARRHIAEIPSFSGMVIDRLDYFRLYNFHADDGCSWLEGGPARYMGRSWQGLMDQLGPMMHQTGKVIFVNPHTKRLDLMRHVDGIYDEFADRGPALNCAALLGVRKPVIAWTPSVKTLQLDADACFQRHLHLGVYPTVPYPENDHAILPDAWAERQYLDYGPLLDALRGKRWVLAPHCVEVQESAAKSNVFEVPGGYVVPLTFGGTKRVVRLTLRGLRRSEGLQSCHAEAIHPGGGKVPLPIARQDQDRLEVDVPLLRGCAIVRLSYAWFKPEQDRARR